MRTSLRLNRVREQQLFLNDFAQKEGSLQAARCFFFDAVRAALSAAERTGSTSGAQQGRRPTG